MKIAIERARAISTLERGDRLRNQESDAEACVGKTSSHRIRSGDGVILQSVAMQGVDHGD